MDKNTELNLKVLIALTRAEQAVHQKEYVTIREGGLTPAQFGVLEILYHKGALKICDIINKTLGTSGNLTVVIKNLEKDGLVRKVACEKDRRAIYIQLTEKGKVLVEDIFPGHAENINQIFNVLTDDEKHELIRISKKLTR